MIYTHTIPHSLEHNENIYIYQQEYAYTMTMTITMTITTHIIGPQIMIYINRQV